MHRVSFQAPGVRIVVASIRKGEPHWVHRALVAEGIDNQVLDSASIEVSRRQKQVKTARQVGIRKLIPTYGYLL
ncbi:MAG: hypothetical protein GY820_29095 [Gammaproteobacteria bacterium]|nr:hypothetical protein [Gammaproteobacteria bacterium]